jgi:uncharacterized membrane protein
LTTLAKAKLASSITFLVLASFTIVTYDRQNMFIIQATGVYWLPRLMHPNMANVSAVRLISLVPTLATLECIKRGRQDTNALAYCSEFHITKTILI